MCNRLVLLFAFIPLELMLLAALIIGGFAS